MVVFVNESNAFNVVKKYRNIGAFTLGKVNKCVDENGDVVIEYQALPNLMPADVVNEVMSGDVSAKKAIKRAVKMLHKPTAENQAICMTMAQLINMISDEYRSKRQAKDGPNVIVFVLDDPDTDEIKARNKFVIRYVTALFQEFGIEPITDKKTIKKIFKGKRKNRMMNVAKYIKKHQDTCTLSKDGYTLKKLLMNFYALELHQSSLTSIDIEKLGRNGRKNLTKALYNTYTNCNMLAISKLGLKKKIARKYLDQIRKKNKKSFKMYMELYDIMEYMSDEIRKEIMTELDGQGLSKKKMKKKVEKRLNKILPQMPKIKFGHKKNTSDPDNVKMNAKKFKEFFEDGDNVAALAMVYAHTTLRTIGVEVGSSEYCKHMDAVMRNLLDSDVVKLFMNTVKSIRKNAKAEKPQA